MINSLNHTILQRDINNIITENVKPKLAKTINAIVCNSSYYFYNNEIDMKQDYEILTTYLNQIIHKN